MSSSDVHRVDGCFLALFAEDSDEWHIPIQDIGRTLLPAAQEQLKEDAKMALRNEVRARNGREEEEELPHYTSTSAEQLASDEAHAMSMHLQEQEELLRRHGLLEVGDDEDAEEEGNVASTSKVPYGGEEERYGKRRKLEQSRPDWRVTMQQLGLTAGGMAPGAVARGMSSAGKAPQIQSSADILAKYRNGAIRMTATPNRLRQNVPNTVRLSDFCRKEAYTSLWASSFLIDPALFKNLAINGSGPHAIRDAPTWISRDVNSDGMRRILALRRGAKMRGNVTEKNLEEVASDLADMYRDEFGPNYRAIYPWSSGIVHSKMLMIEYPDCLVVCITSCNLMTIDVELGDNTWWIQAFPRITSGEHHEHDTESRLFDHAEKLGAGEFLQRVEGKFDFSACRVHLFTSEPYVKSGNEVREHGMLRIAKIVRKLVPEEERSQLGIEVAAASVGVLKPAWIRQAMHFLLGGGNRFPEMTDLSTRAPSTLPKIIFPSDDIVKACDPDAIQAASNMGCALNNTEWLDAPAWVRGLFHEYYSKDRGRMFHLKQIIWTRPSSSPWTLPRLIAFGSANFSQAALGTVRRLEDTSPTIKMNNYECGIVVTGEDWVRMLEPGSSWEDGITYERPAPRYAAGVTPWNSPAWVT